VGKGIDQLQERSYLRQIDKTMLGKINVVQIWLAKAVVAEWLRRLARNQFPSGSVGSNPTNCGSSFFSKYTDI
jgi:hypothetical protein